MPIVRLAVQLSMIELIPVSKRSYLLRVWRESGTDQWRASLRDVFNSESHHFGSLAALFTFLLEVGSPVPRELCPRAYFGLNCERGKKCPYMENSHARLPGGEHGDEGASGDE
jgi:hypothetical protein